LYGRQFPSPEDKEASESRPFHRNVRPAPVHQPPPEKCDVNARANEPKPPRVTPPEPESDEVPDAERLDEESLPKNCCVTTTRPTRRGQHWMKIHVARIRRWFVIPTPFPAGSVRNFRSASTHKRRRQ